MRIICCRSGVAPCCSSSTTTFDGTTAAAAAAEGVQVGTVPRCEPYVGTSCTRSPALSVDALHATSYGRFTWEYTEIGQFNQCVNLCRARPVLVLLVALVFPGSPPPIWHRGREGEGTVGSQCNTKCAQTQIVCVGSNGGMRSAIPDKSMIHNTDAVIMPAYPIPRTPLIPQIKSPY